MIGRGHDSHGVRRIDFQKRNGGVAVGEAVNGDQKEDKLQQATKISKNREQGRRKRERHQRQREDILRAPETSSTGHVLYLQLAFTHLQVITQNQQPTMQVPLLRLQCGMCCEFTGSSYSERLTVHVN